MSNTDLARAREKARSKTGDKSFGTKESESEKAFKLLAAHASPMSSGGLPAQLVVEGLMKQLDTNFQIPKLSARTNAIEADKRSVDRVDSGTIKAPISSKSEELSNVDVDIPTNLSMQMEDQVKAEVSTRHFFGGSEAGSKKISQGNDGDNVESLNLVTKSVEKDQSFHRVSHMDKKMASVPPNQINFSLN